MRTKKEILGDEEEQKFNSLCYFDFRKWAERVFGLQIKPFHLDMLNTVHNNRFVVIKAFRGSGKTTLLGVVYSIWLCWFKPGAHVLFTASELGQAVKILDEVKDNIENNEYLKELMPPNPSTWKKTELKMNNGSRIYCKAFTEHIKGLHVDYAFCDEIQDCLDRDLFNKAIAPTVNQKKGKVVAVGTPNLPGDLLDELMHRPMYVSKIYSIMIKDGYSRWPEKFPIEEIQAIRKRDGETSFQTQYMMNTNIELEGSVYPPDWIQNCFDYTETFVERPQLDSGNSTFTIGADFAISKGARADFDAYVVIEKIANKCFIRWAERHKGLSKDAKLMRLEALFARYNPVRLILDPSGIGEGILQDLRAKGLPVEAGEFHAKARNKLLVNLITMIQPDKNGSSTLVIPRNPEDAAALTFTTKLIEELIGFREIKSLQTGISSIVSKGAHDDTVMALALACKAASEQREFLEI
jgi:hypothetical protein